MIQLRKLVFVSSLVFLSTVSQAGMGELNVGGLIGYSSINSNSVTTSGLGFGARGEFRLTPSFGIGAEWTYTSTTPSGSPAGYSSNLSTGTANLDYHFGLLDGLFVGAKVGLGFTSAGGFSGSSFAVGGEAGYDLHISPSFSVGPQINFLSISAPTINGVAGNSATVFQGLAAIKYWF